MPRRRHSSAGIPAKALRVWIHLATANEKGVVIPAKALRYVHMLQHSIRERINFSTPKIVIPAKAGIHAVFGHRTAEEGAPFAFAVAVQLQRNACREAAWIPAFAGMTMECLAASARYVHPVELSLG